MKIAITFLAGLTLAEGFTQPSLPRTGLAPKMSEEEAVAEAPVEEEVAAPEPVAAVAEPVELFGKAPFIGGELFLGETEWNKFTTEYGSAETGTFLRAAEIKHGRSAMLATVGFALQKLGVTFDKISPHEYLSVSQGIKFADLAAMGPIAAVKAVPVEGIAQVFAVIAAIEIYELTHRDGEIKEGESVPPGLQAGGLTGYNLNYNPLKIEITDRRKLVELQNGRAAMFAISAWVAAETIPGSVPLPFL
eukprot:CAMPEP_0172445640 /NCGR_PEP_ID=MMETSP1065-20121228/5444_1 /TAXON_ID=265537 /ORGANISM="Amphiprora paludosa, Strain CCMP125" /LENGTH=247 /DNA_ID=CAMNT_0013196551 /DNA_START=72 /DNA_END=815 /DNA_ORIENTATION=+